MEGRRVNQENAEEGPRTTSDHFAKQTWLLSRHANLTVLQERDFEPHAQNESDGNFRAKLLEKLNNDASVIPDVNTKTKCTALKELQTGSAPQQMFLVEPNCWSMDHLSTFSTTKGREKGGRCTLVRTCTILLRKQGPIK